MTNWYYTIDMKTISQDFQEYFRILNRFKDKNDLPCSPTTIDLPYLRESDNQIFQRIHQEMFKKYL